MRIIRTKENRLQLGVFGHSGQALKRFIVRARLRNFSQYITKPVEALPDFGGFLVVYTFPGNAELQLFKTIYAIENRKRIGKDDRPDLSRLPKICRATRKKLIISSIKVKRSYRLRCRKDRVKRWRGYDKRNKARLLKLLRANKINDLYAKARAAARLAVVADLL